jgi:threonine/homoserine/homoserine lactone efflux protein
MLPLDTILALVSFAFVSSITPGPNNLMLAASGVNFGFLRTIPHMLGVGIGFGILQLAIGFGVGGVLLTVPELRWALKGIGAAYLLWLAWKMATARPAAKARAGDAARPMSFVGACAFQWVNAKAWIMALGAMAVYVRADHPIVDVLTVTAVFVLVNVPCISAWAGFGHALGSTLADPVRLRVFNITMAVLLVASIVPMIMD